MKINRLRIEQFAVEDYPDIRDDTVEGNDLFISGGNRSGKTLTLNALLYALYGPRATFEVQPGRQADVELHFDNGDRLYRGSGRGGREFEHGDKLHELDEADEVLQQVIGPENLVSLQFVHSETDKLPLARLHRDELLGVIRRVIESQVQEELEEHIDQKEELEGQIEQLRRTELVPRNRELEEIDIGRYERRIEDLEELQSLIESGRIENIKQRLLENEEVNERLNQLYDRKRTIQQNLRKLERQLREEREYTQEVNDLIIDAIEELTCPVCDQVVREGTARYRLRNGRCPQCGRQRPLDELRSRLEQKVERADDKIEELEVEKEELQEELEDIEDEIDAVQSSEPDLEGLNQLAIRTLEDHGYDIDTVAARTERELEKNRSEMERLTEQKQNLEEELEEVESDLAELEAARDSTDQRIGELREESFNEMVSQFQSRWSENYQSMTSDLGLEAGVDSEGNVLLPGNDGTREYDELSTGEARLLNVAFSYTIAELLIENDDIEESLETVVLDEAFANLEAEEQNSALDFIREADIQFIITSSDESLQDRFPSNQVESLETMTVQFTLDEWIP